MFAKSLLFAAAATAVSAKQIWVQVVNNQTVNATTVYQPAVIEAKSGDTIWFNFTSGNHSVIQAAFDAPCIPINTFNSSLNGFVYGPYDTKNGTITQQIPLAINDDNVNKTLWFYDTASCNGGGVGVVNQNASSTSTIDGFRRNALRLYNPQASSSASPSATGGSDSGSGAQSSDSSQPSGTDGSNSASRLAIGAFAAVPLVLVGLAL